MFQKILIVLATLQILPAHAAEGPLEASDLKPHCLFATYQGQQDDWGTYTYSAEKGQRPLGSTILYKDANLIVMGFSLRSITPQLSLPILMKKLNLKEIPVDARRIVNEFEQTSADGLHALRIRVVKLPLQLRASL